MQTEFDLAGVKQDIADMKGDIKSFRTELLSLKRSIYIIAGVLLFAMVILQPRVFDALTSAIGAIK